MGCTVSATSMTWSSQNLQGEALDAQLPMTVRQRYGIVKSWKAISRNMEQTGITMFIRLFEKNQNLKNLFSAFRDIDPNDMRSSQVLENHAMMVMCTIDDAICCLDDLNYVREQLHTVGKSHRRFKNFKPEIFFWIKEPFLDAVKETLGDRYSAGIGHVYRKTITFILMNLVEGFTKD